MGFKILDPRIWRTYIISWNSITRKISIYDTNNNNVIITYEDTEKPEHLVSKYNIFTFGYILINSDAFSPLFRFHICKYKFKI